MWFRRGYSGCRGASRAVRSKQGAFGWSLRSGEMGA